MVAEKFNTKVGKKVFYVSSQLDSDEWDQDEKDNFYIMMWSTITKTVKEHLPLEQQERLPIVIAQESHRVKELLSEPIHRGCTT